MRGKHVFLGMAVVAGGILLARGADAAWAYFTRPSTGTAV